MASDDLLPAEEKILRLKRERDEAEQRVEQLVDDLDRAVQEYLDEDSDNRGPTHLARLLGLTRGRVYQIRNRGRAKRGLEVVEQ